MMKVILLGTYTCENPRTLTRAYEEGVLGNCVVCSLTSYGFTCLRYIPSMADIQVAIKKEMILLIKGSLAGQGLQ